MKLDHRFFNGGVAALVTGIIFYLIVGGDVDKSSVVGMLGGIGFNLALFLCTIFGLQYFQLGTGRDIQNEIFDEHNTAAAIYQGFLFLAIAIVISKGLM